MAGPAMMAERWNAYRQIVLPPNAPQVQIEECRKAFIAGAVEVYRFLMDAGTFVEGDDVTDADMAMMQALNDELTALAENEIRRSYGEKTQ